MVKQTKSVIAAEFVQLDIEIGVYIVPVTVLYIAVISVKGNIRNLAKQLSIRVLDAVDSGFDVVIGHAALVGIAFLVLVLKSIIVSASIGQKVSVVLRIVETFCALAASVYARHQYRTWVNPFTPGNRYACSLVYVCYRSQFYTSCIFLFLRHISLVAARGVHIITCILKGNAAVRSLDLGLSVLCADIISLCILD